MLEIKTVDMTQPFIISPAKTVRARLSARTLMPCVRPRACTRAHYRGLFTNLTQDFPYVRICHRPLEGVVRNLSQSHGTQGTWCRRRDLVWASVCPSLAPHFPQPPLPAILAPYYRGHFKSVSLSAAPCSVAPTGVAEKDNNSLQ